MNSVFCRHCRNDIVPNIEILPETSIHYGKYTCPVCDSWIGFKAKPENEKKLEKRPNGTPTPEALGIEYCQICLRPRERLGSRETLDTHHIDDDPANLERLNFLIVCSACHKLIAWTRTYFNEHLQRFYNPERI
jgi:hypothetical protein